MAETPNFGDLMKQAQEMQTKMQTYDYGSRHD